MQPPKAPSPPQTMIVRGRPPGARLCDWLLFGEKMDPKLYNVLVLSCGFFFVFGGYGPTQQFATTLLNFPCMPLGSISMGLLYGTLSVASIFAPLICRRWGLRNTIIISSVAYFTYVGSLVWVVSPLVLLTSIFIGILGAFMNCATT